ASAGGVAIVILSWAASLGVKVWALRRIDGTRFAFWALLLPVFTAVIAWWWLGERPTLRTAAGAALVIAAAAILVRRGLRREAAGRSGRPTVSNSRYGS